MATYKDICRVQRVHDSLPVSLILRERTDLPTEAPRPYYVLSWRTLLPSGKANRRFYSDTKYGTGLWKLTTGIALGLLNDAYAEGMLGSERRDVSFNERRVFDSRDMGSDDRNGIWASISNEERDADWGSEPLFNVVQYSGGVWRKMMIVDTWGEACTFRGTTTDVKYGQRIRKGMQPGWFLDNAMPDMSVQDLQLFRETLLGLSYRERKKTSVDVQGEFKRLAADWQKETAHLSSTSDIAQHRSYQAIIAMGMDAVPLILRDLKATHSQWFSALRTITGQSPVRVEERGDIEAMTAAWLEWGKRHHYV